MNNTSAFDQVILDCAAARNGFVMPDDLSNDEGEELLAKVRVELADSRELTQTAYLLGLSCGIARRKSVLGLQLADCAGAPEPFRQHVDDRGVDVIDAIANVSKV